MGSDVSTTVSSTITGSSGGGLFVVGWTIAIVIIIVLLFVLYFILNRLIKGGTKSSNIKTLRKFYLNRDFYVAIVKILDEYYLILFSSSSSEVLRKMEYEEVEKYLGDKKTFMSTFSHLLNKEKDKYE